MLLDKISMSMSMSMRMRIVDGHGESCHVLINTTQMSHKHDCVTDHSHLHVHCGMILIID